MRYYDPDSLFFYANSLVTVGCWFMIVHVVMLWLSLTLWRQHIPNPGMMRLAGRLLIGFAVTPAALLVLNLLLVSASSLGTVRDSSLAPILNLVLGVLSLFLATGSFVCFLLAIVPRIPNRSKLPPGPRSEQPVKEPWED